MTGRRKSKYSEEQIIGFLKQVEAGMALKDLCLKHGFSDATFYKWRQKYAGLGPSALRRLRQFVEENNKLKRLVADLSLDKAMLQDVCAAPKISSVSNWSPVIESYPIVVVG
jgi:putative transposase